MSQATGKNFLGFEDVAVYRIPMKKYRKRACRSTRDQHTAFVEYVEKYPYVLDPTYAGYEKLWDELTGILNGRGPRRSADQWQTNLRDWRYATAFKYKRAKKMGMWNLTEVEEKFLRITGRIPDKGPVTVSSDEDDETLEEQPVLMEVTQSPPEDILESPDISSVWFPEPKEIHLDVADGDDVLKQYSKGAPRQPELSTARRWTDKEIMCLIAYVKSTLETFEKPSPEMYYRKFLMLHPSLAADAGMKWNVVRGKMTHFRHQHSQGRIWLRRILGTESPGKLSPTMEVQLLTKYPHFHDLEVIFGGKTAQESDETTQTGGDALKISLPPQITVRNVRTSRVLEKSIPSTSKTPIDVPPSGSEWEEQKLELEIRRFELEKRRYEHEKDMDHQKFIFDSDMRKQELELRRLELKNHRLEVEHMVEVERMRLQQEERIERFKIEMEFEKE